MNGQDSPDDVGAHVALTDVVLVSPLRHLERVYGGVEEGGHGLA